jgi:hypothetical protein
MAKNSALAKIAPNVKVITTDDGTDIVLAGDAAENKILNYLMFAQVRALIQQNIARYADKDIITPKELKDLVEAAKGLAESSTTLYQSDESGGMNKVQEINPTPPSVDFSKLRPEDKK